MPPPGNNAGRKKGSKDSSSSKGNHNNNNNSNNHHHNHHHHHGSNHGGNNNNSGGGGGNTNNASSSSSSRKNQESMASHSPTASSATAAAAAASSSSITASSVPSSILERSSSTASGGGGGAGGNNNNNSSKRKSTGKTSHSRSYPRGVGLDFRKLAGLTLVSYIDHHGVQVRSEAPPSELAVAVARHFEQLEVDEEECIGGFLERLEAGGTSSSVSAALTEYARKTQYYFDGQYWNAKRKRTKWAARPGEQVAAKVTRTDENGSWILASVQRFYADTETYDVQDEDDTSKLIRLPWSHVMRLSTGSEGCFTKGVGCMAIFPETTSFYKATVSKSPVWKLDHGVPTVKEIIVKFEDDEDNNGKTPHRRVPARYVIPVPSQYFYDESEDVDLEPPTRTATILPNTSTSTTLTSTSISSASASAGSASGGGGGIGIGLGIGGGLGLGLGGNTGGGGGGGPSIASSSSSSSMGGPPPALSASL